MHRFYIDTHTYTHTHTHIHQSHSHPFSISERKKKHICLPQMWKYMRLSAQWLERALLKDKGKSRGKALLRNREGVRRRFEGCNFVPINFSAQTFWEINRAWRICGAWGVVERREHWCVCLCVFVSVCWRYSGLLMLVERGFISGGWKKPIKNGALKSPTRDRLFTD